MMRLIVTSLAVCAVIGPIYGVLTKMNFGNDEDAVITNTTKDEDVEVKQTIYVSTKLVNGNRRSLHRGNEGQHDTLVTKKVKEDDDEVPVVNGYRAVETTEIKTPDTREKAPIYPSSVYINRNIPDDYDIYPNYIPISHQWKPSTFYNNINWMSHDIGRDVRPPHQNPGKYHRRISDEGMSEFYCRRCRELTNGQGYRGCPQQRYSSPRYFETTTHKMKIDGKLAKLY